MYGYLYERNFNPFNESENLIYKYHGHCHNNFFHFRSYLQFNIKYILVVRLDHSMTIGEFSVVVNGQNKVNFIRSKYSLFCA